MDEGARFGLRKLLRFNGHFFKDRSTIQLTREDLVALRRAAEADWQHVEPSIFGTLLTRALDPVERHRLGAEYTPRAFIDRVVRPTVEEPIRERWTLVEGRGAAADRARAEEGPRLAAERLGEFHDWLRGLRFLDPACGSGNFLYVTLRAQGRRARGDPRARGAHRPGALRIEEVNPAAVLRHRGEGVGARDRRTHALDRLPPVLEAHHAVQPPEPVLQDTGHARAPRRRARVGRGAARPGRDRPDPTPRVRHPVTGALVPDPAARLRYEEYVGARPAPWPEADFIVGNPPYLGQAASATRSATATSTRSARAYPDVPDAADYVMYWWYRAAEAVASGRTLRAGLITTNSITQAQNRRVIARPRPRGAA